MPVADGDVAPHRDPVALVDVLADDEHDRDVERAHERAPVGRRLVERVDAPHEGVGVGRVVGVEPGLVGDGLGHEHEHVVLGCQDDKGVRVVHRVAVAEVGALVAAPRALVEALEAVDADAALVVDVRPLGHLLPLADRGRRGRRPLVRLRLRSGRKRQDSSQQHGKACQQGKRPGATPSNPRHHAIPPKRPSPQRRAHRAHLNRTAPARPYGGCAGAGMSSNPRREKD